MLKKTLTGIMFASLLVLGYVKGSPSAQAESELTKENIEALALFDTIEKWWNRKDYICVEVTCVCPPGIKYTSSVWKAVSEGTGSVAHQWSCSGCGDCGFYM
ncbi:MAG: hypothetical protein K2F94_06655 [Muribaculaceae bacterium]|nr:hypothetical protein [Muribaculaceae bacterium]